TWWLPITRDQPIFWVPATRGYSIITELTSVRDVWKTRPVGRRARRFLKNAIWGGGRFCPTCGSPNTRPLHRVSLHPGLYQCIKRECSSQITVTTRMPPLATNLDLGTRFAAMFLVLTAF
ncbi:MAG TPA: hypothetical protein DEO85_16275, partial [Maritimibacter sp.]|nr:hypothetical protein [Maritimibacter sp.]